MRIALVFPGQGSQEVGMGEAIAHLSPSARMIFQRADEALGDSPSISSLCFRGPLEQLTLTRNTQPALLTTSIALFEALKDAITSHGKSLDFTVSAGHSLGEYTALVAVGALTLEDTLRLVRVRGEAMQHAVIPGEGAMAALVGADEALVNALCAQTRLQLPDRVVAAANFNAPGQIVIAGHADAVALLISLGVEQKVRAIPLKVSAPFHCSLMEPAARAVAASLRDLPVGVFSCPVVSNVDARPYADGPSLKQALERQVVGSVRWEQCVREMISSGVDTFIEIGPGRILQGLIKRISKSVTILNVSDPVSLEATARVLTA